MNLKSYFGNAYNKIFPEKKVLEISRVDKTLFHWKIVVISFVTCLSVVFVYSYMFYEDVNSGEFLKTNPSPSRASDQNINKQLDATVKSFEEKKKNFNLLKNDDSRLPDPSV